jgi:dienelactone hydrolase
MNNRRAHSAVGYSFDFKNQYLAANGYFVLTVNFRSSTGYGEKFLWGTWGAWGDRDGEDVVAGIDYVISRYPIDRNRVATIGHSYGGFMSNWLIVRYPDRFAAAAVGAGIVNWVSDYGTADIAVTKETEFFGKPWEEEARNIMIRQSPLTYAGKAKAATLFIHGEVDQRVPYSEAEQMYVALGRTECRQRSSRTRACPRHQRIVERRPPDDQRTALARHLPEAQRCELTNTPPPRPYVLGECTWTDVGAARYEVAILPWGATEAHNRHLPYATDNFETESVAIAAAGIAWERGARVLVLPTVPFGVNTGQREIPFCVNMMPGTQTALIRDVLPSLQDHGIRKLVLLNGHGGNDFRQIIRELQPSTTALLAQVNWTRQPPAHTSMNPVIMPASSRRA